MFTPSNSSDLAWNRCGPLFPTQDIKIGIQGKRNGCKAFDALLMFFSCFWVDDAEWEWRAHGTQICQIEADTKKNSQEVLTTTNRIQDAIEKNNIIFAKGWEATHDQIDHRSEEILLLKNWVVDLESFLGLQQTALQHCQDTIVGLEETVAQLVVLVKKLEKTVCWCHN